MQLARPSVTMLTVLIFLFAMGLASCTPTPTPPPAAVVTLQVQANPSATLIPTATVPVVATDTPEPTDTPSVTPKPTASVTPTPAPTATPAKPTVVSTPVPGAARDALVKAFGKLDSAYPYRLVEDTTAGGATYHRVTDFAAADRTHSTFTWGTSGSEGETIRIGSQLYWKLHGQWSQVEPPGGAKPPIDNVMALLLNGLQSVQFAGQEAVNGVEGFVFTYTLKIPVDTMTLTGGGKVWVGVSDGVPHQATLDGTLGAYPLKTLLIYSYGVKFDIQAPLP